MATFYLLPPKPLLGDYLKPLFPGLSWTPATRTELGEALVSAVAHQPDVFVVYREELPAGENPARALADGFGAEPADEVIEIRPGKQLGEWTSRRWRLGEVA